MTESADNALSTPSAQVATRVSVPAIQTSSTPADESLPAQDRPQGFNVAINGFRGACVLFVFAYHVVHAGLLPAFSEQSLLGSAIEFFTSSWRYGVELFFMISGYVIVISLRRHGSVSAFLRDRFLRIFPVWIPIHTGIFIIGVIAGWKIFQNMDAGQEVVVFITNLLLIPPLLAIPMTHPASWSLTYEWLFYLLSAAAFTLSCRKPLTTQTWWSLWLGWSFVVTGALLLLPRAIFFLPGVIIALGWLPLRQWRGLLRWPSLSLLVFLLAWRVVDVDQAHPGAYPIAALLSGQHFIFLLLAVIAGLHLFACICSDNGKIHWLHHPAMQLLGTVSFSFYLWHPIVMFVVKKPITMWMLPHAGAIAATTTFALLSFMVALAISWLSYQLLERRLAKTLRAVLTRNESLSKLAPGSNRISASTILSNSALTSSGIPSATGHAASAKGR